MISLNSVEFSYSAQFSISFKDWTIMQGEHWLLQGESGSGKTTLLHILTGLLKPGKGEVVINETSIYQLPGAKLDQFRGKHIGLVFQRPHLLKSLTVFENLLIAQSFAGLKRDTDRVHQVLSSLNIADKLSNYPGQLSQGQLQRVAIARAVINKPGLIMADEPTSSLDDKNARAVLDLLIDQAELNEATLIIATHDNRVKERIEKSYSLSI
jgi:putative ABC transport system ATP-binding protein